MRGVADPLAVAVLERAVAGRGVAGGRRVAVPVLQALLERCGERVGLRRRALLEAAATAVRGVGDDVVAHLVLLLAAAELARGRHRLDLAGARHDHRLRGDRLVLGADVLLDGLLGGLLHLRVDRGLDGQTAALEQFERVLGGLAEILVVEDLVLNVEAEVRVLARFAAARDLGVLEDRASWPWPRRPPAA